jgi:uncharacterized protein YdaU (DUF1376 family)
MHYYSHHLGDYAKNTGHLSLAEHGAYRMLLDHYYSTETGLPENLDALCRICRATSKAERQAVDSVLREFFFSEGKTFKHRRVEREISDYRQKSESAAKAGKMSGEARRMKAEQRTIVERPLNDRSISVNHSVEQRGSVEPSINQEPRTNVLLEKEPKGAKAQNPEEQLPKPESVRLAESLPRELHESWSEWQAYRQRRAIAKGKDKLAWTYQAARIGAKQIADYAKTHGSKIVADRIASAIGGNWQGLNLDKLEHQTSRFSRPEDMVSHTGKENGFDF